MYEILGENVVPAFGRTGTGAASFAGSSTAASSSVDLSSATRKVGAGRSKCACLNGLAAPRGVAENTSDNG